MKDVPLKILIVQIGRIGDMVLVTPMLRLIKERFPDALVDVLASPVNAPVVMGHSFVRRVIVFDKRFPWIFGSLGALRSDRYDWMIDPKDHHSHTGALLAQVVRAGRKAGYGSGNPSKGKLSGVSSYRDAHIAEKNCRALEVLDIPCGKSFRPWLDTSAASDERAESFYGADHPLRILVNLSSGHPSRGYDPAKWRNVIARCRSYDSQVVLNAHGSDREIAESILREIPGIKVFGTDSLMDVAALVKHSSLLISPDTSLIHMASAFDIPTLGLYPDVEWNYRAFGPLSARNIVLRPEPGGLIRDIPEQQLLDAVEALLVPSP